MVGGGTGERRIRDGHRMSGCVGRTLGAMPADETAPTELGIDFGTSNTVAVLRRADGRAQPLLFDGSPMLPSAVYADPDGAIVVGKDALQSARLHPGRFEPNPKRRVDEGAVQLGDREVAVVDLIAAVLGRVVEEVRRTGVPEPASVTLTCPASWGATRRLTLTDAAERAGLAAATLLEEPVAAAAYFAKVLGRDVPIGSVVVVHDLGGGTFDASVVARTSSGFEVLAVDGRPDIGGLDLDKAIVDHLGGLYGDRNRQAWERLMEPSSVEDRRSRRLLWDDARAAKERLSRQRAADLVLPLLEIEVHLTRTELEKLAEPILEQTVRVTQGVMRWAKLAEGRAAGVFLVGGSSRIPLLATLLHRALGEPPVAIDQPELVVAEGSLVVGQAPPIGPGAWVSGSKAAPTSPAGPIAPAPRGALQPATVQPAAARQHDAANAPTVPVASPATAPTVPVASPATAPTVPVLSPSDAPTVPTATNPGDEPTQPVATPSPSAPPQPAAPQLAPPQPAPAQAAPEKWAGRVLVPGAKAPGQKTVPAPVAPTQQMQRYQDPAPTAVRQRQAPGRSPTQAAPQYRRPAAKRGRSRTRRFLTALFALLLLIAVPVVSAYVAYKLANGDNPFEWPPTVDYDKIFGR